MEDRLAGSKPAGLRRCPTGGRPILSKIEEDRLAAPTAAGRCRRDACRWNQATPADPDFLSAEGLSDTQSLILLSRPFQEASPDAQERRSGGRAALPPSSPRRVDPGIPILRSLEVRCRTARCAPPPSHGSGGRSPSGIEAGRFTFRSSARA